MAIMLKMIKKMTEIKKAIFFTNFNIRQGCFDAAKIVKKPQLVEIKMVHIP